MRLTLLSFGLLFIFLNGFSQTEKRISGKVISAEIALSSIDIVNMTTKKVATTDSNGFFTIAATVNDELYFISKELIDRKIVITHNNLNNNLIVDLTKKPIELEEVKIEQKPFNRFSVSQADMDVIKLEKQISRPVNTSVYTGEIVNGMDFVRIFNGIVKLFKNKDKGTKRLKSEIVFKDYVKEAFQEDFYTKTLELKPEQIFIFIEFCDADANAKTIVQRENILEVGDFLIYKKNEFKKL